MAGASETAFPGSQTMECLPKSKPILGPGGLQKTPQPIQALEMVAHKASSEQTVKGSNSSSGPQKRKKVLKINISAANEVAEDIKAYNTNSLPKQIDVESE